MGYPFLQTALEQIAVLGFCKKEWSRKSRLAMGQSLTDERLAYVCV